jgi:hypothetical protein
MIEKYIIQEVRQSLEEDLAKKRQEREDEMDYNRYEDEDEIVQFHPDVRSFFFPFPVRLIGSLDHFDE